MQLSLFKNEQGKLIPKRRFSLKQRSRERQLMTDQRQYMLAFVDGTSVLSISDLIHHDIQRIVRKINTYYNSCFLDDKKLESIYHNIIDVVSFSIHKTEFGLNNKIVSLIPKSKFARLDFQFASFAFKTESLVEFGLKTYKAGYYSIGEIVQLPEEKILEMLNGDEKKLHTLRQRLAEYDLPLGGRAPGWQPPPAKKFLKGCMLD